ncbi:PREDICTED: G patch domain-containing protein 2-like [Priapulus caudatus]|uniref:G patch domain-containing protein 2-like n=1 Tax=Priapulus caudatus TaxID=37621 RepID=A0ABM1E5X7_PRICU|nr:PREDICTED: G patch domain-containing protein 2-like [Priapulus caudatus]
MCKSSQQNFKCRLNRLNGLASREMRSGRRRLRDRRSLHTLPMWAATSDRICQVLMDPTQAEVRVRPGNKMERKYVAQYPTVYSLEATAECAMKKSGILIKSRHAGNQTDMKRLKRTPPSSPCAEESSNHAEASIVPEQDSSLEQSTESHCLHPTGARPRRRGSHDTPHAPTKDL